MTRLRARGGVRDKPPIIDDDEDDFFAPIARKRKTPATRKDPKERKERVERPRKEPVDKGHHERIDNEREITTDENSLYFIVRHSKNPIAVGNYLLCNRTIFNLTSHSRALLTSGSNSTKQTGKRRWSP